MDQSQLLRGSGYDQADLFIVGDYARRNDAQTGFCLSGYYAGKIKEHLSDANFNIDQSYRTCIIKYYEKGLGVGTWKQDAKILEAHYEVEGITEGFYLEELVTELNLIKPAVILGLGEFALRVLTGKEGIGKWRGSILPLERSLQKLVERHGIKVVCTEHPYEETKQEEIKFLIRLDVQKAVDLLYRPGFRHDYHKVRVARNFNDYLQFRTKYDDHPMWMTTDIETRLGFITCASFSFDGEAGLTIPMTGASLDPMDKARMCYALAKDLEDPLISKSNQNIGYDKLIYQRFGYRVAPVRWDTMLAASVIAPEFQKDLGFLTSIYTDMPYYKDEGRDFDPSRHSYDQLYEYCARDSISAYQIMQKQREELEARGDIEFLTRFVMPLFDMYFEMQACGFPIDIAKRDELIAKYEALRELKYIETKAIVGGDINLNSSTQVGKFMEANKFPVLRHRVESGFMVVNTDVESLRKMRSASPLDYRKCEVPYESALRFLNLVLLIRRINKILEYLDVGIHPWGRVHTSVKIGGTSSGRTSNSKTPDQVAIWETETKILKAGPKTETKLKLKRLGCSFQTVTKHGFIVEGESEEELEEDGIEDGTIGTDVREIYKADPGWAIVEIDRSQAEARVVDLLSEDYEALEEYGKIDKHCKTASYIFTKYSYDEIFRLSKIAKTPDGEYMRFIGKKGAHAANYDMGDFRLSSMANIPISFAREILIKIHNARPKIRKVYHYEVEKQVKAHRMMENPYGRIRMFYKSLDGHGIKVAYSWYPQSTISDGTKKAALYIHTVVDRDKAFLLAENHDSLTAMVHHTYIRKYVNIAKPALEAPIDFRRGSFPRDYQMVIPVEVSIGRKNWGQMKDLKLKKMRMVA